MRILCALLIMICVGAAACGASGDSSTNTTSTLDVVDSVVVAYCEAALETETRVEDPLGLTEADVLVLLADPDGREGIAEGIVSSTGITLDEARCFLDTADPTIVAALFSIGVGDQTQVDPEVASSIFEAFATCGLPSDTFG
jgi:hypothetical protein